MNYYEDLINRHGDRIVDSISNAMAMLPIRTIEDVVFSRDTIALFTELINRDYGGNLPERDLLTKYDNLVYQILSDRTQRTDRFGGARERAPIHGAPRTIAEIRGRARGMDEGYRDGGRVRVSAAADVPPGEVVPDRSRDIRQEDRRQVPAQQPDVQPVQEPAWFKNTPPVTNDEIAGFSTAMQLLGDDLVYIEASGNPCMSPQEICLQLMQATGRHVLAKVRSSDLLTTAVDNDVQFNETLMVIRELFKSNNKEDCFVEVVEKLPRALGNFRMSEVSVINQVVDPIIAAYFKTAHINGEGGKAYLGGLATLAGLDRLRPGRCCEDKMIEADLSTVSYADKFKNMCVEIATALKSISIVEHDSTMELVAAIKDKRVRYQLALNTTQLARGQKNNIADMAERFAKDKPMVVRYRSMYMATSIHIPYIVDMKQLKRVAAPASVAEYAMFKYINSGTRLYHMGPDAPCYVAKSGALLSFANV